MKKNEVKQLQSSCDELCKEREFQYHILKDVVAPTLLSETIEWRLVYGQCVKRTPDRYLKYENCIFFLKKKLNIESLEEFSTNEQARDQFIQIREDFLIKGC